MIRELLRARRAGSTLKSGLDGADGKPSAPFALLLLALLLAAPAARAEDPAALVGRPMRELAAMEDVAPMLRSVVRGRQQIIFEHLRAPGAVVHAIDGHLWAWGCEGGDCRRNGLFLARDPDGRLFYMALIRDGELDRQVPPRGTAWPTVLVDAVAEVHPELRERLAKTR